VSDIEFLLLVGVVGFLLILFLFILLFRDKVKQIKNEENQKNSNNRKVIIHSPKSITGYGTVSLILGFFLGGITIPLIITEESATYWFITIPFFSIVPVSLLILGSLCFLYYFKWRLIIDDERLTQISIMGTKKHFSFDDVSKYKLEFRNQKYHGTIYIHLFDKDNKRICKIPSGFKNAELLISRLLEKEISFEKMPLRMTKKQRENFKWPPPYDI